MEIRPLLPVLKIQLRDHVNCGAISLTLFVGIKVLASILHKNAISTRGTCTHLKV